MSEIAGIIDNLEIKIDKLLKKISSLEKKSQDLNIELAKSVHILQNQSKD
jgi:restriction endonuclease S subunit